MVQNDQEKIYARLDDIKKNLGQDFCGDSAFYKDLYFVYSPERLQRECRPDPVNIAYLDSIVKLTQAKNIVLYLGVSPINEATYKVYKNSTLERSVTDFYNKIKADHPNLHLITDPIHMSDSTFGDKYLHPNRGGSLVITNQLVEHIKAEKKNVEM